MHISPFPIPLLWDVPCQIQLVCSLPGRVSKENTQPLRAKSAIAGSGGLCDSGVSISKPVCKHISLILQRRIFIIIIVFALYLLIPLSSPCLFLSFSLNWFWNSAAKRSVLWWSPMCQLTVATILHTHKTPQNLSEHLSHFWIHWSDGVTLLYVCSFWGPGKRGSSYPREALPARAETEMQEVKPPSSSESYIYSHPIGQSKKAGKDTLLRERKCPVTWRGGPQGRWRTVSSIYQILKFSTVLIKKNREMLAA